MFFARRRVGRNGRTRKYTWPAARGCAAKRIERGWLAKRTNRERQGWRPSELFRRNYRIAFEPVEDSLSVLADYVGPHKVMWATDYPHPDGFFPGAPAMVRKRPANTSDETAWGSTGCADRALAWTPGGGAEPSLRDRVSLYGALPKCVNARRQ